MDGWTSKVLKEVLMDLKKDCVSHRKEFELYFCSGGGQLVTGQSCFDTIPYSKFGHVNIDFREHFSCAFQAFFGACLHFSPLF